MNIKHDLGIINEKKESLNNLGKRNIINKLVPVHIKLLHGDRHYNGEPVGNRGF